MGNIILPGLITVAWLTAALVSNYPLAEGLGLVVLQSVLAFFTFAVLVRSLSPQQELYGPRFNFFIGLHVLLYYGLSNVIPALLPELRPETITTPIPTSPVGMYSLATVAAALLLLGLMLGFWLASRLWPLPCRHSLRMANTYAWLPPYKLAILACVSLLALVMVGTIKYAAVYDTQMMMGEALANMPFKQQLFFHGLFYFLPLAPVLAAAAFVQAVGYRQRRSTRWLLVIACLMTIMALLTWGMRSVAMLALAMPLGLLVYAGKVNWRKVVLPAFGLVVIVYGVITIVRGSDFRSLLAQTPDITQLSMSEVGSALTTRGENQGVMKRALSDASYRTAGLEATAALIQAQTEAHFPLAAGKTIRAGFMQALPASLRPAFEIPERIKTAPFNFEIFQTTGDWVTTLLAEFVLDFGPFLLFFPAVLAGFGLTFIDRALLGMGRRPALAGLLILRLAFFLFMIVHGDGLADMTLKFFKATIGYTALFILLGNITRISLNTKRRASCSVAEMM